MRTFRDFMEAALYDPERGFYPRRTARQDFYTAPELHKSFAGVLARHIGGLLKTLSRASNSRETVVEIGAGEGLLAEQLLPQLPPDTRYVLIERCDAVRRRALERLARFSNVETLAGIEKLEPCAGVFFSNELVDALPVHVLEKSGGRMKELHIDDAGREVLGDLSTQALSAPAEAAGDLMGEGDRHAVSLEAARWLELAAERMIDGYLMTIDYGKRFRGAPNPPRAYYRHTQPSSLAARPGRQDLTAAVDFDALLERGEKLGLTLESYQTLSRFLLDGGIGDWLPEGDSAEACRSRAQIKTLLHPEGMGEAFKVLVQRKQGGRSR